MADPIKLPPLPEPLGYDDRNTEDQLRARDLEVARVVLEAATNACGHLAQADAVKAIIRALEFHHAE